MKKLPSLLKDCFHSAIGYAIVLGVIYGLIGIVWWIQSNGTVNAEDILGFGFLTLCLATLFGIGQGIINFFGSTSSTSSRNSSNSTTSDSICIGNSVHIAGRPMITQMIEENPHEMSRTTPASDGATIRLIPDAVRKGRWAVAFRNDGPGTLSDVTLFVSEGGIPCPGDLGSTLVWSRQIDKLGQSDEFIFGSFHFIRGGEYLDLPLSACLCSEGHELMTLMVTENDFDHLETLRGVATTSPKEGSISWLLKKRKMMPNSSHAEHVED